MPTWDSLNLQIVQCGQCPRLRDYCNEVARRKRRAYRDCEYWGRPVPNFGDPQARLLIVGLAPAAHGANRTGRMFTGDRSGEWLYRALNKAGFASQAQAIDMNDGLKLKDCAITAVCHCAPPANKPTSEELANCRDWLSATIDLLPVRVVLALGQMAWKESVKQVAARGWYQGRQPRFSHNAKVRLGERRWLLGSYHPSQQNTFTGRLTEEMLDSVMRSARRLLGS